jgi:hypothetical protein
MRYGIINITIVPPTKEIQVLNTVELFGVELPIEYYPLDKGYFAVMPQNVLDKIIESGEWKRDFQLPQGIQLAANAGSKSEGFIEIKEIKSKNAEEFRDAVAEFIMDQRFDTFWAEKLHKGEGVLEMSIDLDKEDTFPTLPSKVLKLVTFGLHPLTNKEYRAGYRLMPEKHPTKFSFSFWLWNVRSMSDEEARKILEGDVRERFVRFQQR